MPLCYGGGVKSVEQAQKIIKLGAEKVAISSIDFDRSDIIDEMAAVIGRQSVVVFIDIKKNLFGKYEIYTHNGKKKIKQGLDKTLSILEEIRIGVLQLDNYRSMRGFNWPSFKKMNLRKQDKGQKACAKAFVIALEGHEEIPIPIEEVFEVTRVSIELQAS